MAYDPADNLAGVRGILDFMDKNAADKSLRPEVVQEMLRGLCSAVEWATTVLQRGGVVHRLAGHVPLRGPSGELLSDAVTDCGRRTFTSSITVYAPMSVRTVYPEKGDWVVTCPDCARVVEGKLERVDEAALAMLLAGGHSEETVFQENDPAIPSLLRLARKGLVGVTVAGRPWDTVNPEDNTRAGAVFGTVRWSWREL